MHYPDLSQYLYASKRPIPNVYNIGWLDKAEPYEQGSVADNVAAQLVSLLRHKKHVNLTRGFHPCPFCGAIPREDRRYWIMLETSEGEFPLGSAELWIPDQTGGYFASPDLIVHYVLDHRYQPPQAYINALLAFEIKDDWDAQTEVSKIVEQARKAT